MDFLEDVQKRLAGHSLVRQIDRLPQGHIRIETALLYPDGGSIDVFLQGKRPLIEGYDLTDFGQTIAWLLNVQVKPWESKKRRRFMEDTLRICGVEQNGGALEFHLENLDELPKGVIRLGQACSRVSDLTFTRRSTQQSFFSEEVEEVFVDNDFKYDINVSVIGRYGKPVRVDYRVYGRLRSAILTLSASNPNQARSQSTELFRRWYDLGESGSSDQNVTIYDDRRDVYNDEDLLRLRDFSILVPISDRPTIIDVLAA